MMVLDLAVDLIPLHPFDPAVLDFSMFLLDTLPAFVLDYRDKMACFLVGFWELVHFLRLGR